MKNVMTRAWEIAKAGVKKFGGTAKMYFKEALIIAWKEVKNTATSADKARAMFMDIFSQGKNMEVVREIENGYEVIIKEKLHEITYVTETDNLAAGKRTNVFFRIVNTTVKANNTLTRLIGVIE
ncbi:hypothetical protein B4102_3313 [Heyndrickxia sporothermodurans]|uniref:Uncharacterized protein n=1 Tax=Heyndrickxia sporothermodurans TaxID=46224 RepID=A0A150KW63_9BACI|nr:hypothetical protein [Heyndrickxia sporothermodurans]KYD04164.1 hypothetical protein B4102_3313 [Heyndrickxia sporothermodurans]